MERRWMRVWVGCFCCASLLGCGARTELFSSSPNVESGSAGASGRSDIAVSGAGGALGRAGGGDAELGGAGSDGIPADFVGCDLKLDNPDRIDLPLGDFFGWQEGVGATMHAPGHLQQQGLRAQEIEGGGGFQTFEITVGGSTPSVGAVYTIDPSDENANTSVVFASTEANGYASWNAVAGGIVTVTSVSPSTLPNALKVTFAVNQKLVPSPNVQANQAKGVIGYAGYCRGDIAQ